MTDEQPSAPIVQEKPKRSLLLAIILFLFGFSVLGSLLVTVILFAMGLKGIPDMVTLGIIGITNFNLYAFARLYAIYYKL
jgi:hypothetical protein